MNILLDKIKNQLEKNNFEVFTADNTKEACEIFLKKIWLGINAVSGSYADSQTLRQTKVLDYMRANASVEFIDTFNKEDAWRDHQ